VGSHQPGRILVVGSLNLDHTVMVTRLPDAGATVAGHGYSTAAGGKGLNQAVAAARQDAAVLMIGAVGLDPAGGLLAGVLDEERIGTAGLRRVPGPSGTALITVSEDGDNTIVVAPGANGELTPEDLRPELVAGASIVLCQLEVPVPVVRAAFLAGRAAGALTVLNPAPASGALDPDLLALVDLVVANEGEAAVLTGLALDDPAASGRALLAGGARTAIVTLGARGALVLRDGSVAEVSAFPVEVVDPTAAGDAFLGAMVAALAAGETVEWAARRGAAPFPACRTARKWTVLSPGAQWAVTAPPGGLAPPRRDLDLGPQGNHQRVNAGHDVVKVPDQGATVLLGQEDHEADRGEAGVELVQRVEALLVVDLEAVKCPEVIAIIERGAPVARRRGTGRESLVPAQDPPEVLVPFLRSVALVGDEGEMAAGTEHPPDLPAGLSDVKPMKRLGDGHRVRRPRAERELLGAGRDEACPRCVVAELGPHTGHGLDRNNFRAGLLQEPGELAGAGGHVDDHSPGPETELVGEDLYGGIGIARPAQLVASTFGVGPPGGGVGRRERVGQGHGQGC
jgi:ribokinase